MFNVKDFGAVGDGVYDDTTAIQAAVYAASAPVGFNIEQPATVVQFPNGKYRCNGELVFDGRANVVLRGPAQISYTGSGSADFISLKGCSKFTFEDLIFTYTSNTYSGRLFHTGPGTAFGNDTSYIRWNRCYFYGENLTIGGHNAAACISMSNTIVSSIRDCIFTGARVGVRGQDPAYVNSLVIEGCAFTHLVDASIYQPGEAWYVSGNTFEPLEELKPSLGNRQLNAVLQTFDYDCRGFSFIGNWIGDGAGGYGSWINLKGRGITISGNMISGDGADSVIKIAGSQGVDISGNVISGTIEFKKDIAGNFNFAVALSANDYQTTNDIRGLDTIAQNTFNSFASDNGAHFPNVLSIPFSMGDACTIVEPVVRTVSWTPGMIANGAFAHTEVVLPGAHYQDHALARGVSPALPAGILLDVQMFDVGVVRITMYNVSGAPVTIPASTFKIFAVH